MRLLLGPPASTRFAALCCLIGFVTTVAFYYPGSLSWDSTVQWHNARTGRLTAHYPPFMSFVWHWLDLLVPGPGLVLVLQLAVWWLVIWLLLRHLRPSRSLTVLAILFLSAQPMIIVHAALVEKNVIGANLALAAFMALLGYAQSRHRLAQVMAAFVLLALAGLMRFQFWALAIPLAVCVALGERTVPPPARTNRAWLALAMLAALALPIGAAQQAMQTTMLLRPSNDRNWRQVMLYDVGAVLALAPDTELRHFAALGIDLNELRARVRTQMTPFSIFRWSEAGPYLMIADSIGDALGEPSTFNPRSARQMRLDDFTQQWWDLVKAEPGIFIQTRAMAFLRLLGIGGPARECWPLTVVGFLGMPENAWRELNGAALREAYATTLLRSRIFPADTFLFRPIIYAALSIALFAFWWRRPDTAAAPIVTMTASIWLYWLTFLPFNPDCEVRYSYFPCAAVLLALTATAWTALQARAAGIRSGSG